MNELDALRNYAIQVNVKYLELERKTTELEKLVVTMRELLRTTMEAVFMIIPEEYGEQDYALRLRDDLNNVMDKI